MGFPATTFYGAFDAHALSVGIYQDLIPSTTFTGVFNPRVKAARVDNVGMKATFDGGFNPIALAARTDNCRIPATVFSGGFTPRIVSLTIPMEATTFKGTINMGGEPEGVFDPIETKFSMTIGGSFEARVSYNNPNLNGLDVARQIYYMWGFQTKDIKSIGVGIDSITMWVNSALQLIFSRADRLEYFNRETITVTVPVTGHVDLATNIQRLQGAVRRQADLKTLRPLDSQSDLEQFATLFLDATSPAPSGPLAYYLDTQRIEAAADSVKTTLRVAPVPTVDTILVIEVTKEAPRYSETDLLLGRIIEIPHVLVETLLLPIVKKWALADPMMPASNRSAMQSQIDQQYGAAMNALGLAEPATPQVTRSRPTEAASTK